MGAKRKVDTTNVAEKFAAPPTDDEVAASDAVVAEMAKPAASASMAGPSTQAQLDALMGAVGKLTEVVGKLTEVQASPAVIVQGAAITGSGPVDPYLAKIMASGAGVGVEEGVPVAINPLNIPAEVPVPIREYETATRREAFRDADGNMVPGKLMGNVRKDF